MNDYISREAAISEFSELQALARKRVYDTPTNSPVYMRYATQAQERDSAVRRLMALPSADVVEVVHGEWINAYPDIEPNPMFMYGICSQCGFEQSISDKLNYCPNCGAKMDGGADNG
jgi:rubrerythrin